jgi:peptidoglycan/xylan/chitin deacetylase (PgdA/CDA1 family)
MICKPHQSVKNFGGVFLVSLDFELYWGVRDVLTLEEYGRNISGVHKAVPRILNAFKLYGVHATWAVVGYLFFNGINEIKKNIPHIGPTYLNPRYCPYKYISEKSNLDEIYHFAPNLINEIGSQRGQEIATHTFSHYYCLEMGQTKEQFDIDLKFAIETARRHGFGTKSLVFPRNQWNEEYLDILNDNGVLCYRGNEISWLYQASKHGEQKSFKRALRFVDSYLNLTGHNTYDIHACTRRKPFNIPASRFLRPYLKQPRILNYFHLQRIKAAMKYAAEENKIFHLWWHPHNFGVNLNENIDGLLEILRYYNHLNKQYRMISLNMGEIADICHERIA